MPWNMPHVSNNMVLPILTFGKNYQMILGDLAVPEVDAISAPKLDQQLLSQGTKESDKEMFNVQRAFLNAKGPLCGLHGCIETDSAPTYEEIKLASEHALCLWGSANAQLSILRRQKVFAGINRSSINLAEPPLPNAKSCLVSLLVPFVGLKTG